MSGIGLRMLICLLIVVTAGCRSDEPGALPVRSSGGPETPDTRPVVDMAPYWCDLVPREALVRISGASRDPAEFRTPTNSASHAVCGVKDGERYGPLGVTWDLKNGRELIASSRRQVASDRPQRLPAQLGSGFISYSPDTSRLPYETASLFRCGSHEPWIYLALRRISPGRNVTEDLTALMRIAQGRFGVLHRCSPQPL